MIKLKKLQQEKGKAAAEAANAANGEGAAGGVFSLRSGDANRNKQTVSAAELRAQKGQ
jgi:hypothetical protein